MVIGAEAMMGQLGAQNEADAPLLRCGATHAWL